MDHKLPSIPPQDDANDDFQNTPQPPPKFFPSPRASPSLSPFPSSIPPSPHSPVAQTASPDASKPKKSNPLNDLIDTERSYVDQLTGIIRKVASAWSRSNLPPTELDTMFRSIEGVYKANRSLLAKLKEIGTNPSSPKALGDLLMRWIDDLETPYSNYCAKYSAGFDTWEPVQSNPKLTSILSTFSATTPPPASALSNPSDPPFWTLDMLFLLPKGRLKYYKKLYTRLLKSTAPGRSDHRLLLGAVSKLDRLFDTLEQREKLKIGESTTYSAPQTPPESEDQVVMDMRSLSMRSSAEANSSGPQEPDAAPSSENSSSRNSSTSGGERLSKDTISTSISQGSSATMSMPITDLERRLSTQRTLDIFTMNPKAVRLQMVPPSLPFTREMRCSLDTIIRLTPRATGVELVHPRGHIFLLSDLFLVCERMTPEERSQQIDGADMWLCYPPLAGKVLRISEVPGQDTLLQVHIMRKETLTLETESAKARDALIRDFKECIEFASSVGPISKQPPPPLPPLPGSFKPTSAPVTPTDRQDSMPSRAFIEPDQHRSFEGPSAGAPPLPLAKDHSLSPRPSISGSSGSISPGQTLVPGQSLGPGQIINPGQVSRTTSMASHSSYDSTRPGSGPPMMNGPHPMMPGMPPNDIMQRGQQPFIPPPQNQSFARPIGPGMGPIHRPPSAPSGYPNGLRKAPSTRSLSSMNDEYRPPPSAPPLPNQPGGYPPSQYNPNFYPGPGYGPSPTLHSPQPRPVLPSAQLDLVRSSTFRSLSESPPNSPMSEEAALPSGPVTSTLAATMKCKVFLKQQHAQWKSLGSAKLKVYKQSPTNVKQLVVESDKDKVIISTIVLSDGVERVGKTGVAVEVTDQGRRTGIVYMIQLRNETSAGGLFTTLLEGSDRSR